MQKARIFLSLAVLALTACSKAENSPQVFLPRIIGVNGEDLESARLKACDSSKVNLGDRFLTQENFRAMFNCANYDRSLSDLEPLFRSADFPKFIESVNLVLQSGAKIGRAHV